MDLPICCQLVLHQDLKWAEDIVLLTQFSKSLQPMAA